ncbi:L,D-transpeptidase [Paracoccus sp. p4-l81]|uniref:L,D-transpeptidase n=1 Tax=unclassified Paracoccus (in: a-proteobacteria) TaxID=2688777 RepID=UPI0035B73485
MMNRRFFVAAGAVAGLSACAPAIPKPPPEPPRPVWPPLPAFYGAIYDEPYPIPAVPEGIVDPRLWRQSVDNPYPGDPVGSIVVDPGQGYLYLLESRDRALRYGVGTGRQAFSWSGVARMQFKRKWPVWRPTANMIARDPSLEPYSVANGGMRPGPPNPLGSRALYLFQNGVDTYYRIHGGCEPQFLGKAVSAGCIRMLDQDAIDLYDRVGHGVNVRVLWADQLDEAP